MASYTFLLTLRPFIVFSLGQEVMGNLSSRAIDPNEHPVELGTHSVQNCKKKKNWEALNLNRSRVVIFRLLHP